MDSYKIYKKLYRRLMSQSVFYIPSELVVDGVQEMVDVPLENYTDQLLYLAKSRRSEPLQNPEAFEKILAKSFQLENTVSYLIEQKSIMDEGSFSFILEKYMEKVNLAYYVSKLLYDNVKAYFPNEPLVLYNSFLVQQNAIHEHRNQLVKTLNIANNEPFDMEDLKNLSLLRNPAVKDMLSLKSIGLQPNGLHVHPTDSLALISDEQAQIFLLETVFSIPFEKIGEK